MREQEQVQPEDPPTSPLLLPGENPRLKLSSHRERGPRRYLYTARDVAAAAGAPMSALRRAVTRAEGAPPELDLRSLQSVLSWVLRQRALRGRLGL